MPFRKNKGRFGKKGKKKNNRDFTEIRQRWTEKKKSAKKEAKRNRWSWAKGAFETERWGTTPKEDGSPAARISIRYLPPHVQRPHVFDFVTSVTLRPPMDIYIRRLEMRVMSEAIVALDNMRDARVCVRELNHKKLEGVTVRLKLFTEQPREIKEFEAGFKKQRALEGMDEWTRLSKANRNETEWMEWTNLTRTVDEQAILDHIRACKLVPRPPKCILLYQHPVNAEYPGFARIQCHSKEEATTLIERLQLSELHGQRIWAEWKRLQFDYPVHQRAEHRYHKLEGETRSLEILNLDPMVSDEELLESVVTRFPDEVGIIEGEMDFGMVFRTPDGFMQRRAVVQMSSAKAATMVFEGLHQKRINGSPLWVEYRPDEFLEAQMARKELLEKREYDRQYAIERLTKFGDDRSMKQIEEDTEVTKDRKKKKFTLSESRVGIQTLMQLKERGIKIKIDPTDESKFTRSGVFKPTAKYGTNWEHTRADLLGIKRPKYEVSERWGTKYV